MTRSPGIRRTDRRPGTTLTDLINACPSGKPMVFNSTEVDIIYREPTPLPSSDAPSPRTETSGGSFTAPYRRC